MRHPFSAAFEHQQSWFLGLQTLTGIYIISSPRYQVFKLRLNYITGSPGSLACRWRIVEHPGLCVAGVNFYNHLSNLLLVLFLWRSLIHVHTFNMTYYG